MPFQKGNTYGNRAGRPKSYDSMADLLRDVAAQPHPSGVSFKQRIARVVMEQAAKGVPWAVEFYVNRTEGKLTDKVEQSGTVKTVIEVRYGDGDGDPD